MKYLSVPQLWQMADDWMTNPKRHPQGARHPLLVWGAAVLLAVVCWYLGLASSFAGTIFSQRPLLLAILPLVLILGFIVLFNRYGLMLTILVLRAGLDPILEETKLPIGTSSMGLGGILNGLIILLAIWLILEHKQQQLLKLTKFFAPYLIIVGISITYSPMLIDSIKLYLNIITYVCAFLLGAMLVKERSVQFVMKLVVSSSFLPIILALGMLAIGSDQLSGGLSDEAGALRDTNGRFFGPFTHPNIFAFYIVMVAACIIMLIELNKRNSNTRLEISAWLYIAILSFFLLKTQTRSAWVAYGTMFFLYAVTYNKKLLIPILLAGLLASLTPEVHERLMDLDSKRAYLAWSQLNSYEWRKRLWAESLDWLPAKYYLMGMGMNSFRYYCQSFFSLAGNINFGAHSVFVQTFFEQGIIGFIAFIYLLLHLIKKSIAQLSFESAHGFLIIILTLTYSLVCYSDNMLNYTVYNIYHWLFIGGIYSHISTQESCTKNGLGAELIIFKKGLHK